MIFFILAALAIALCDKYAASQIGQTKSRQNGHQYQGLHGEILKGGLNVKQYYIADESIGLGRFELPLSQSKCEVLPVTP